MTLVCQARAQWSTFGLLGSGVEEGGGSGTIIEGSLHNLKCCICQPMSVREITLLLP